MDVIGFLVIIGIFAFFFWITYKIALPIFYFGLKMLPIVIGFIVGIMFWSNGMDNVGMLIIVGSIIGTIIWRKYDRGGKLK